MHSVFTRGKPCTVHLERFIIFEGRVGQHGELAVLAQPSGGGHPSHGLKVATAERERGKDAARKANLEHY